MPDTLTRQPAKIPAMPPLKINGLDPAAIGALAAATEADPDCGQVMFRVTTDWQGQLRSTSTIDSCVIGSDAVVRRHTIRADKPHALLGTDTAPTPQELLMAAVNACMVVGYVAQAALRGISLTRCRIHMDSQLDLRGFLGLGGPAGSTRLDYVVDLAGEGSRADFEEIHAAVLATSPNVFNLTQAVPMHGRLA